MTSTGYRVEHEKNRLTIYLDGKMRAKGFADMGSALHAIWSIEGKVVGDRYSESSGYVYRERKLQQ